MAFRVVFGTDVMISPTVLLATGKSYTMRKVHSLIGSRSELAREHHQYLRAYDDVKGVFDDELQEFGFSTCKNKYELHVNGSTNIGGGRQKRDYLLERQYSSSNHRPQFLSILSGVSLNVRSHACNGIITHHFLSGVLYHRTSA